MGESLSLVGATGGAGTTRLTVEFGATLARDGRSVALLDAAYATQGLAGYVHGRIDPDVTALVTGEGPLESGLVDLGLDVPGRVAACPAAAPFDRLARAKTPEHARRLATLVDEAADRFDYAIVDTPPVASNQAVAAVDAADLVTIVTPASERGADAATRGVDRLADVGVSPTAVVANGAADGGPVGDADAAIPRSAVEAPSACPASVEPDAVFAPAVATAVETLLGIDLELSFDDEDGLDRYLPDRLRDR